MEILKSGERIDDLQVDTKNGSLKLIQHKDKYCFTTDSCILANFAKVKRGEKVLDIGSGSGIISILLAGKYQAKSIVGVEIQQYFSEMSERSIRLNSLENAIRIENLPVQELHTKYGHHSFDVVVSNPPYSRIGDGETNIDSERAVCRHEVKLNLQELASACERNIKYGGRVYLVHQAERLSEIFENLTRVKLEPKRIRFVQGKVSAKPTLVLIEAHSNGASGLIVEHNLVLYNDDGTETDELKNIYGRRAL